MAIGLADLMKAVGLIHGGFYRHFASRDTAAMPIHDVAMQTTSDASFTLMAVVASFLLAGFVKGAVGLGLPTVAMGLLGSVMPPTQAALLLLLPSFVTNVWQMFAGRAWRSMLQRLWGLQVGVVLGTVWAPVGLAGIDARMASIGMGAALLVYAALGLGAVRLATPLRWQPLASPVVGAATGLVTAATGVFVFPAVPYLQGLGLPKDDLVQAMGLTFTVSTLALGWRLAADGALTFHSMALGWVSLLPLLAALVGMGLGQALRNRISEPVFRRVFFAGLLLIGLELVLKAVLR